MGLRFMGGEKIKSLADAFGCHLRSTDRAVDKFLKAVDISPAEMLSTNLLPQDQFQKTNLANEWNVCSGAFGIMYGHLAPIDGWLCTTLKPWDVPNPSDYRSGHYQRFGLNVQAMCDANLRIIYLAVAGPGKMNDARAYRKLFGLHSWMNQLEDQYFCSGDNAYPLTNKMLIPFSGVNRFEEYNRVYNYFLCQLRIRIEMCFGRLTTKWRIFRSDLSWSTDKNSQIIRVGAKLHNYVINADNINLIRYDNDNFEDLEVEPLVDGPLGNRGYLPVMNRSINSNHLSSRRDDMIQMIRERDMVRPEHNIDRNG